MKKNRFAYCVLVLCLLLMINFSFILGYGYKKEKSIAATNVIREFTIYIDPGHGGKDNGTSFNDIVEDEINLKIALKIYEDLLTQGYIVLISRTDDYDLSDMYAKNHKIQDLNKRIQYIKENKVDIFVSIHLNSYGSETVSGAQVFYKKNIESSKNFAILMQEELNKYNKKDKKPKIGDYYLFNNTGDINGILVECGFLSNSEERSKLVTDKYQSQLAKSISGCLVSYLASINK